MNYQVGFVGTDPPMSGTWHHHNFPNDWSTVSISSSERADGSVDYTIVIDVTSSTTLGNDVGTSGSIPGIFLTGTCSDDQGPTYRIPGLAP
jgi:hypothetical protein